MIEAIELVNIEGHKYSVLEFVPGVNTIIGASDGGKSVIIRAIRKVVENRPSKNLFISDFRKRNQESSITIGFTERNAITFANKGGKNQYIINGDTDNPYKAIRTDVPEGVRNITNMGELNIQIQNEPLFLLNKTGGQVAKEFNKFANLTVMDNMLSISNSYITKIKAEQENSEKKAKEKLKQIKELAWIDEARSLLIEVKQTEAELIDQREELFLLEEIKDRLYEINLDINNLSDYDGALDLIDEALEVAAELEEKESELDELIKLKNKLGVTVQSIKKKELRVKVLQSEYDLLLKKSGTCPFCGAKT